MFRLKECTKCGGDLYLDYEDWHCMQCARTCYSNTVLGYRTREGLWGNLKSFSAPRKLSGTNRASKES